MGTVKLCAHEMARTPYLMDATGVAGYSIEELAYYLYEKLISSMIESWEKNSITGLNERSS